MRNRSIISILLAVALLCGLLPCAAATDDAAPAWSGVCGAAGNNLTWTLDPDTGTLTVRGSGDMADYDSENKAPWEEVKQEIRAIVLEEGVTGVGSRAFYFAENAVSLRLPASLNRIGASAFHYCMELTEAAIPAGVTALPDYAFCECISLRTVSLPDSLTAIGKSAFNYCVKLNGINWPSDLNSIGDSAFVNADLQTVVLPEGVMTVGANAFEYNNRLTSIRFPDSVQTLGSGVVANCGALTEVRLSEGLTEIPKDCFLNCRGLETVEIPVGVTKIGESAFSNCDRMWHLTLPSGVTQIGSYAFSGCDWLLGMELPAALSCMEFGVFEGCERLRGVAVRSSSMRFDSFRQDMIFNGPENTTLYGYVGSDIQSYAVEYGYPFVDLAAHVHSYGETVLEPSCTACGYTVQICGCGDILRAEPIAALGHAYRNGKCTRCGYAAVSASEIFSDVKQGAYYDQAVLWAIQNGVTSGTGDGSTFSPKKNCTREQIMSFLWIAAGSPEPETAENPFTDVKPSKYYYKAVLWAVENGITTGATPTTFGVGKDCTRAQVMSFLWIAMGSPEPETTKNPFTDVKPTSYYYKAVLWAVENGVCTGTTPTTFGPKKTCTRGQIVTFLYIAFTS